MSVAFSVFSVLLLFFSFFFRNDCGIAAGDEWFAFDVRSVAMGDVVILGGDGMFLVFYDGGDHEDPEGLGKGKRRRVGLGASTQGRQFGRVDGTHPTGAVLEAGEEGEFDELGPEAPRALLSGPENLTIFYHSRSKEQGESSIGMGTSRNALYFKKLGRIISPGPAGSFDEFGLRNPSPALLSDGSLALAYEGIDKNLTRRIGRPCRPTCLSRLHMLRAHLVSWWRTGMAISRDGETFEKADDWNPILGLPDDTGAWDAGGVGAPCLVPMAEGRFRLYYAGYGKGRGMDYSDLADGIGLALGGPGLPDQFSRRSGDPPSSSIAGEE